MTPEKPLKNIFMIFGQSRGFEKTGAFAFSFGGKRLFGDETPQDLQLSDGDCLQAEARGDSLDLVV